MPPRIRGYSVRNTVTVSIDDMKKVGDLIDAATTAGANSVEGIQFVVGQDSPAQGEALALASKQAMAKAEAIAAAMNGRIVRVVQTTEGGIDPEHVRASYGKRRVFIGGEYSGGKTGNSDHGRLNPDPIASCPNC